MKQYLLLIMAFVSTGALAHTITYDNGDVYTVAEDEYVFVSKRPELWRRSVYNNGKTMRYEKIVPTEKVDYVPPDNGTDGEAFGTHEWCKAYIPWSEGYTFTMQYWQRGCDTNNDNKYGCGDEKYDASEDGAACPSS